MIRAARALLADLQEEAREEGWVVWVLCAAAFFGCLASILWMVGK